MAKAKFTHTDALDAALNVIKTNATTLLACTSSPTDRATALSAALADKAITSTDFTGPTTGDAGGNSRKLTVNAQNTVTIDTGGTAAYVAIIDGTRLLHVGTCTDLVLVQGQTVNFPAWDIEFAIPTAG